MYPNNLNSPLFLPQYSQRKAIDLPSISGALFASVSQRKITIVHDPIPRRENHRIIPSSRDHRIDTEVPNRKSAQVAERDDGKEVDAKPRQFTVKQAAEYLGLNKFTVYSLVRSNVIFHRLKGPKKGRVFFLKEDLDEYLNEGCKPGAKRRGK